MRIYQVNPYFHNVETQQDCCEHSKIFKVCLAISEHYERKE